MNGGEQRAEGPVHLRTGAARYLHTSIAEGDDPHRPHLVLEDGRTAYQINTDGPPDRCARMLLQLAATACAAAARLTGLPLYGPGRRSSHHGPDP